MAYHGAMKRPTAKTLWLAVAVIALTVLSTLPILDEQAEEDYESLFQRAVVTFALARTLNGVISAVQGTELAVQPAGVGVTLTPGEVLDPINDLVERFSVIMLAAAISLGVQNVLLDISEWWGMRLIVALAALAWLGWRLWRRDPKAPADRILLRIFLVTLFLRFAVPLTLIANDAVFDVFLEPRYTESTHVVETAGRDLAAIEQGIETDPTVAEEPGFFSRLFGGDGSELGWRERFERMQQRAGEVIEHLIHLSVVFVLQTGVLPVAFLWIFLTVLKRVVRWTGS